ncbi:unnamed protein product [Symbiodinium sp. CCMP2592]|nr:unnamed protein product [Symbiodinium sp. CCMP2592]
MPWKLLRMLYNLLYLKAGEPLKYLVLLNPKYQAGDYLDMQWRGLPPTTKLVEPAHRRRGNMHGGCKNDTMDWGMLLKLRCRQQKTSPAKRAQRSIVGAVYMGPSMDATVLSEHRM